MDLSTFEKYHITLQSPLLLIKAKKGALGCGYFNIDAFNRGGEAGVIVRGVKTHEDMLKALVVNASDAAKALGVEIGMTGEEALKKMS